MQQVISPQLVAKPISFWLYLKGKNSWDIWIYPLRGKNSLLYSDPSIYANILNEQFKSIFMCENTAVMPDKGLNSHATMPNTKFNNNGVINIVIPIKLLVLITSQRVALATYQKNRLHFLSHFLSVIHRL